MKKTLFLIIPVFIFFFSCDDSKNNDNENINTSYERKEDKVLNAVISLPEYKDANIHVNAMTNGEQSLTCIINEPNEDHTEFYITVGYNQETWFEPYYHFIVNPETFEIFIEDVIEGDVVSMDIWRKREETRFSE